MILFLKKEIPLLEMQKCAMCVHLGLVQIKIQPIGSFIRWVDKWLLSLSCRGGCDLSLELNLRRGA